MNSIQTNLKSLRRSLLNENIDTEITFKVGSKIQALHLAECISGFVLMEDYITYENNFPHPTENSISVCGFIIEWENNFNYFNQNHLTPQQISLQ